MTFSALESQQVSVLGPVMPANFNMSIKPFLAILHLTPVLWNLWVSMRIFDVVVQVPHVKKIPVTKFTMHLVVDVTMDVILGLGITTFTTNTTLVPAYLVPFREINTFVLFVGTCCPASYVAVFANSLGAGVMASSLVLLLGCGLLRVAECGGTTFGGGDFGCYQLKWASSCS